MTRPSEVQDNIQKIKREVLERARLGPPNVDYEIEGQLQEGSVTRQDSPDWFFAMGKYKYWYTARIKTGTSRSVDVKVHFKDTYNWDKNKSTPIEGIRFSDRTLGTLHQAGLAREYSMGGSLFFTWNY